VKLGDMCKFKEEGEPRKRDIETFNVALLGKWKWRLETKRGDLWKELLNSKYEC